MNTAVCAGFKTQSWKDLYQAAISESDLNKLPGRINDAEAAIVICARELFYAVGDDAEEGERLDDALCILQALRRSLKHRPSPIPSTINLDYKEVHDSARRHFRSDRPAVALSSRCRH